MGQPAQNHMILGALNLISTSASSSDIYLIGGRFVGNQLCRFVGFCSFRCGYIRWPGAAAPGFGRARDTGLAGAVGEEAS